MKHIYLCFTIVGFIAFGIAFLNGFGDAMKASAAAELASYQNEYNLSPETMRELRERIKLKTDPPILLRVWRAITPAAMFWFIITFVCFSFWRAFKEIDDVRNGVVPEKVYLKKPQPPAAVKPQATMPIPQTGPSPGIKVWGERD